MTDFLSVDLSVALNIHLCHAGCHARAPSTTYLLVTIIGASIYHNYITTGFFSRHAFPLHCRFFWGELSPHLRLFLMIWGLCNCVTAFPVSSSAAGLSCTGLKCHEYYECNTAKRSFIHVYLLIPLFSILVFGCLEADDRSCRRLRHCSLVNSSIK